MDPLSFHLHFMKGLLNSASIYNCLVGARLWADVLKSLDSGVSVSPDDGESHISLDI